jgi:E3 ubiquitin-protein ligase HUWE1
LWQIRFSHKYDLQVLISLAKGFPVHFLPGQQPAPPGGPADPEARRPAGRPQEFWETLLKLDRECWSSKKGKSVVRSHSSVSIKTDEDETAATALSFSAFGQLLSMLSSPVIKRSSLLTDKLLRLLSLISLGQPDLLKKQEQEGGPSSASSPLDRAVKEEQIQLAVEVLTSKACSEEGLEDVTALLLNLSYGGASTHGSILLLLLAGARQLGTVVSAHVSELLAKLAELEASGCHPAAREDEEAPPGHRGVLADRFTKEAVVLVAPAKPKGGGELQLNSMTALTSKTSSQSFFLRVLKVIIQLREAALLAIKKAKKELDAQRKKDEAAAKEAAEVPAEETAKEPAAAMEVEGDRARAAGQSEAVLDGLESLSSQLALGSLWDTLSACLKELAETPDHHAVLVLQPTVEAFFLVHTAVTSSEEKKKPNQKETRKEQLSHIEEKEGQLESEQVAPAEDDSEETLLAPDTKKFLEFAETHRTVLNQILRQSTTHLADGPFCVLVDHTRVLDFDIKRRYFRTELERLDEGIRREDLAVHVRRDAVFEESFRELHRRSAEEWKNRFYIVFEGEEGQDAGGLLREWYVIISREIFNPNYALFKSSPGDRVTYTINDFSHINSNHLCYFKFVGRVIAKAIYDNKLLECYFARSFYKHILAKVVKHQDMESEDYEFYKGLDFLLENNVSVNSLKECCLTAPCLRWRTSVTT